MYEEKYKVIVSLFTTIKSLINSRLHKLLTSSLAEDLFAHFHVTVVTHGASMSPCRGGPWLRAELRRNEYIF